MRTILSWGIFSLFSLTLFAQQSQPWVEVQFDPSLPYLNMLQTAGVIDSDREGASRGWMLRRDYERYAAAQLPLELRQETERPFLPLSAATPDDFALLPNYPNPFNPSTTITYRLGRSAEVALAVFNQLGQQIRLLRQQRQPAGIYHIVWDGKDDAGALQASGVYFCRLKAGDTFTGIRKMIFLK